MKKVIYSLILMCFFQQQSCRQTSSETLTNIDKAVDYFNNQNYEQALIHTEELIKADNTDYVAWTLKGRCLFNLKREKQGIDAISKAIQINPKYYKAYSYRAIMYNLLNFNSKYIIDDLNIFLSHEPKNIEIRTIKAGVYFKYQKFDKALKEYNQILKDAPNNYKAITFRASIYKKLGKLDLALRELNKVVKAKYKSPMVLEERASVFIKKEMFDKAISDYNKILSETSNKEIEAYTLNNRGFAYHKKGDNQKALVSINQSLKLLSSNSYAYKNRALVYIDMKKYEDACNDLNKSIEFGYTEIYNDEVEKLIEKNCK